MSTLHETQTIEPALLSDPRFTDAISYAKKAHEGQIRKGDGSPFINHPLRVASYLYRWGASADVIIAGLLHDVIEDADKGKGHFTAEEIEKKFGAYAMSLVRMASVEDKDAPWQQRKETAVSRILKSDNRDFVLLECADKLDNLMSDEAGKRAHGDAHFDKLGGGKQGLKWYARALSRAFMTRFKDPAIDKMLYEFDIRSKQLHGLYHTNGGLKLKDLHGREWMEATTPDDKKT